MKSLLKALQTGWHEWPKCDDVKVYSGYSARNFGKGRIETYTFPVYAIFEYAHAVWQGGPA